MKYSEARPSIRTGDLLAWSHRRPWFRSWYDFKIAMVRAFTQSEYSHVGTAWVISDRVFVIEAVVPKVRIYPLSKTGEFYWVPLSANVTTDTESYMLSKVGEDYSQLQAIEAFFKLPSADSLWECAELSRDYAKHYGVDLGNKATPTALVREAMLQGSHVYLITQD